MRWLIVVAWVGVACQRSPEVRREDAGTVAAAAAPAEFPWTLAWVKHVGTPHPEAFRQLAATPDDGVVVAGNSGRVRPRPNAPAKEASVYGGALYLAKISARGEWQWARSFDGKGANFIAGVAVSKDGKIWLGGDFQETVSGLGLGPTRSRTPFVVRLSAEGVAETKSRFATEGYDKVSVSSLVLLDNDGLVAGAVIGSFRENGSAIRCSGHTGVFLSRFASDGSLRYAKCLDVVAPHKGHGPQLGVAGDRIALCVSGQAATFPNESGGVRLFSLSAEGTPGPAAEGGTETDECHAVFPLADGVGLDGSIPQRGVRLWRAAGLTCNRCQRPGTATPRCVC